MAEMDIVKPITLDLLDTSAGPALSSTNDVPVVETKPDSVPEPKAAPAESEADKTPAESATAEPEAPTDEQPGAPDDGPKKPPRGVQKRLDELTQQREEANRRAETATEALNKALAALEKITGASAKEETQKIENEDPEPQRPVRSSYDDMDQYESAVLEFADQKAAWVARREVKAARAEDERQRAEKVIKDEQTRVATTYQERKAKAAEKYADFKEVAESAAVQVSPVMAQAIVHDEHGADLQYYFGKHPDEAKRIISLNPFSQLVEMGKIVAAMSTPALKDAAPEPAKPNISAAPKPIKPVVGAPISEAATPKELDMDAYAAKRRKEEGWGDPQRPRPTRH